MEVVVLPLFAQNGQSSEPFVQGDLRNLQMCLPSSKWSPKIVNYRLNLFDLFDGPANRFGLLCSLWADSSVWRKIELIQSVQCHRQMNLFIYVLIFCWSFFSLSFRVHTIISKHKCAPSSLHLNTLCSDFVRFLYRVQSIWVGIIGFDIRYC